MSSISAHLSDLLPLKKVRLLRELAIFIDFVKMDFQGERLGLVKYSHSFSVGAFCPWEEE